VAFLAPIWLSLAALTAVPVLLHLLRRNIGARIEFPAVRYLLSAEKESSKDVRAKNLLLLLLRVLAVLLLALAAARPVWTRGEGAPRALAIVLDNSLSTSAIVDGASVLSRLTTMARDLSAASQSAEQLWLITADGTVFTGQAAVDAALSRVTAIPNAGQLDEAIRAATALTQSVGASAGVVAIITDGQRSAFAGASASVAGSSSPRIRVYVPPLTAPPNGAILSAVAQPQWWTPRGALSLTIQPVRDSTAYRVALGDNTIARGFVVRAPGESLATVRVPLLGSGLGWQSLDVTLEPSGVGGDDHASVPIVVSSAPAVRDAAGEFVAAAVGALRESGRVRTSSDIAVSIASAAAVRALPALILPPVDAGGVAAANASLARLGIPWRFGAEQRGAQVARGIADALRGDSAIKVTQWFPLIPQPGAAGDTVAMVGSAVWMVRGAKWILIGSPLDVGSTTLPLRASFVPWLADAISNLASGTTTATSALPGEQITVPAGATELRSADAAVRITVAGATLKAPPQPGVWFWMRGATIAGALHVALRAGEPLLARATPAELLTHFGGAERAIISAESAAFLQTIRQAGAAQSLGVPLLFLALLAILAEAWVSGRYKSRTASAAASQPSAA
jgi:hypothetical protein